MADASAHQRRGLLLILSSPSGAGKTTLTRNLVEQDPGIRLSISVTTRPRRPSEIDGVHYRFIDVADFHDLRERGDLLEWAEVHGNFYGTPRRPVERALAEGQDVLFDIDWQGAAQIAEKMRADVVSLFVLPPSMAELKARLERRAEDDQRVIANRLANAASEMNHWTEYDYIVINDDLERALNAVRSVLTAERLRRSRQTGMSAFVAGLISRS